MIGPTIKIFIRYIIYRKVRKFIIYIKNHNIQLNLLVIYLYITKFRLKVGVG